MQKSPILNISAWINLTSTHITHCCSGFLWSLKSRPRSAELRKAIDASLDDINRALLQAGVFGRFGRDISVGFHWWCLKILLRSLCRIRFPMCDKCDNMCCFQVNLCCACIQRMNIYVYLHIFMNSTYHKISLQGERESTFCIMTSPWPGARWCLEKAS